MSATNRELAVRHVAAKLLPLRFSVSGTKNVIFTSPSGRTRWVIRARVSRHEVRSEGGTWLRRSSVTHGDMAEQCRAKCVGPAHHPPLLRQLCGQ